MVPTLDGGSSSGTPTTVTEYNTVTQIIMDVNSQMNDFGGVQWTPDDLIPYLNLAIAEIIRLHPTAYPVTEDWTLVAGARQNVGLTTMVWILDVVCNLVVGTAGTTIGQAVTILPRKAIDQAMPSWQTFTASATVQHVIRDEFDPYTFYVFPPQPSSPSNKLRMIFSELPPHITSTDDDFPLEESYKLPCMNYMLFLVLREETRIANNQAKSAAALQMFFQEMGVPAPQKRGGQGAP